MTASFVVRPFRRSLLTLAVAIPAAFAAPAEGGATERAREAVVRPAPVLRGIRRGAPPAPSPPPPLTLEYKSLLTAGLGTPAPTVFATVTPAHPIEPGRALFEFFKPYLVDAGHDHTSFHMEVEGVGFNLWINAPAPGSRFLVDCRQSAYTEMATTLFVISNEETFIVQEPSNEHLTWVAESGEAGWFGFQVKPAPIWWGHWKLNWCEITQVL